MQVFVQCVARKAVHQKLRAPWHHRGLDSQIAAAATSIRISAIRQRAWRKTISATLASPLDSSPFPQQSLAAVRGEAYSRHGIRYCCWRCSGCCCCAATRGSCWSCCSSCRRATNGSRSFLGQSHGHDTPNFDIRHRPRSACALNQMFRIEELLEEFAAATNVFRHVFPISVSSHSFRLNVRRQITAQATDRRTIRYRGRFYAEAWAKCHAYGTGS